MHSARRPLWVWIAGEDKHRRCCHAPAGKLLQIPVPYPALGRVLVTIAAYALSKVLVLSCFGSAAARNLNSARCLHPGPRSEAQLQYGLLLYFCRKYDDAWIELALYLERYGPKASANGQPGKREGGAGRGGMLGREHEQGEQGSAQSAFADYSATESDAVVGREAQAGPEVAGRAGGSGSMEDVAAQSADHGGQSNGSTVPSEQAARVQMLIEKLRLLLDFAPASVNN